MKTLLQDNTILSKDAIETYLTSIGVAGDSTLTVNSIDGFAVNQIILIGEFGEEKSEIILTHATTSPSGTTITLASNLEHTHSVNTKVKIIPYNQIEFSHCATITGTKEVLDTIDIITSALETRYDDTSKTSGYYFTRFKETITGTYSSYSDAIPFAGLDENTVGFAINYALKRNKLKGFTEFIDHDFCLDEINSALNFITGKLKGWTSLQKFNQIVGQSETGVRVLGQMPSDIWENKGDKSILDLRLGTDITLEYKRWAEFEQEVEGSSVTVVSTQAEIGDTSLAIDNSYDFNDTGIIHVYINGQVHSITYTGVTRSDSAGYLTGIPATGDGSIDVVIPVATLVWQGESIGKPLYYTIDSDSDIRIAPLPSSTYNNLNAYMDYYTAPTRVDSDADTLDHFRYDAIKHWLTWAIRMQKDNDGIRNLQDGDYIQFLQILNDYIRTEKPNNRKRRGFKTNGIFY